MSLSLVSGWIFAEKRRLVEVFPEPVRRVWNEWELRVMALLSLVLQISLISLGSRRKYNASNLIRISLWSAYLMADFVATVALGVLFNRQGNLCNCGIDNNIPGHDELTAFWAPFLLLHLGGPDTITAYALADNELWIRHLLGLIVQTGVAVNIALLAWRNTWLSYLTIPMLLAGTIKYGERSWSLRYANRDKFRDSVLNSRDPGPSYAKFMEEFRLKEAEGYHVTANEVIEVNVAVDNFAAVNETDSSKCILLKAQSFFKNFKRLFVDLILSFQDRDMSQSFFQNTSSRTAFQVIEVELGFAYDVFYTKAPVNFTHWGFFFRFITSTFTCLVFIAFCITIPLPPQKHKLIDPVITYILLGGAIVLEVSAVKFLLSSDWTNIWLIEHPKTLFSRAISCLPFHPKPKKRWSKSMNQYNLLSFSFSLNQMPFVFHRLIPLHQQLQTLLEMIWEKLENLCQLKNRTQVSDQMEDLIFAHFLEKSRSNKEPTSLCTCRGSGVLEKRGKDCVKEFSWTTNLEFDHSILIWHVATSLCYSLDDGEKYKQIDPSSSEELKQLANRILHSKQLADYMLYLLVIRPFMLPIGIGMIRFRDTCAEAMEFFQDKSLKSVKEASAMLTEVSTKVPPIKVKGDRSKSVLFEACRLAISLQKMADKEEKWEMVSNVWVEMLGYAASHCRGYYHAQQLQKGGELLTHVWLLMAHLGITELFQISQGHARAKMAVR